MSKGLGPLLLLGGVGAIFLMGKKKPKNGPEIPDEIEPDIDDEDGDDISDEERCNRFLTEIYVDTDRAGELPIVDIAVEQDFIPLLRSAAQEIIGSHGGIDPEAHAPIMAIKALQTFMPFCNWVASEAGLTSPNDERAEKIYNALILLANEIAIEEEAASHEVAISPGPAFEEAPSQEAEFDEKD